MKQYAVVKDHISGGVFGYIVRDGITDTCYGVSVKGIAWAEAYNGLETKSLDDELPYGVEIGDFRGMASFEQVVIEEISDGGSGRLLDRSNLHMVASTKTRADSSLPTISDAPLRRFAGHGSFQSAVEYKVRTFLADSARSSVLVKSRLGRFGLDATSLKFKSREEREFFDDDLENAALGSGNLRRIAKDLLRAKSEMLDEHEGYSLSPFETEVKAGIGPRIGGGLRSAPRGMSFVDITGRVDGDNDGIVFEGVPGMERPIIPRFTVPKNMARRVSALVDGDSMEIEKQRRAGNPTAGIDQNRLNQILGDAARFVKPIGGMESRRGLRRNRTEDYPRMDQELVDRLRRERFVPETSRAGRARQNRIINTPAADGGPPPRAVRERSGRVVPEPPARGFRSGRDMRDQIEMDVEEGRLRDAASRRDDERARGMWADSRNEVAADMFEQSSDYRALKERWESDNPQGGDFEDSDEYADAFENFAADLGDEIDKETFTRSVANRGMSSRRAPKEDWIPEGQVVLDQTLDEVAFMDEELQAFRRDVVGANEPELEQALDELLEALETANGANDVTMVSRESLQTVVDGIANEVDNNPPNVMLGRVGGVFRDALEADANGEYTISLELDERGTRLSLGRPDAPETDSSGRVTGSMRRSLRDRLGRRMSGGFRSAREAQEMNENELTEAIDELMEEQRAIMETLDMDQMSLGMLLRGSFDIDQFVARNYEDDEGAKELISDLRDKLKEADGLRLHRSQLRSEARDRQARQRRMEGMRRYAEDNGLDVEETLKVDSFVERVEREDIFNIPGVEDEAGDYVDLGRRSSWGGALKQDSNSQRGTVPDGPLEGWTWTFDHEETFSDSTYFDPAETLGGFQHLELTSPDGKRTYVYEAGLEDSLSLEHVRGMRSSRSTASDIDDIMSRYSSELDGDIDIDAGDMATLDYAKAYLNGKTPGFGSVNSDRRSILDLGSRAWVNDLNDNDRQRLSDALRDAADAATASKYNSIGMGSKKNKNKGKITAPAKAPSFTDNSNEYMSTLEPSASSTIPSKAKGRAREVLKVLAANGFQFGDTTKHGFILLPDRLHQWTREQPQSVVDGWATVFKGGTVPSPGRGITKRITGWSADGREESYNIPRWIDTIFGAGAYDDLVANAKNGGRGKVGRVPSTQDMNRGGGMRSERGRQRRAEEFFAMNREERREYLERRKRAQDFFKLNREERRAFIEERNRAQGTGRNRVREAQNDVSATRGLGGGMRSRKRRGTAGVTKVSDRDGQAWSQMSPSQRDSVKEAAIAREGGLFWDMTKAQPLRGARQNMVDDGLWDSNMSDQDRKKVPVPDDLMPIMQATLDKALRDGSIDAEKHAAIQKQLDDLKTLQAMRKNDDYSLLEHLHDTTQKRVMMDARKANNDVPTAARLGLGVESTFHAATTERASRKAQRAAKRSGKRRTPLSDRFLRPDPERERRRQNRRMRRAGQSGRRATEADISATDNARRKLARTLRRARRKLRGGRDEGSIRKEYEKKRGQLPLSRDKDGNPVVDDKFIDFAGFINAQIIKRQSGEISAKTRDDVLLNLWENGEMNGKPTLLDEDEFQALIDAGWTPIHRGMGNDGKTQGYVDSYKEDEDRFIPAQGGRAYGVGEYWAPDGKGGHWGHYGHGLVGFVDPEGRKKTAREMTEIKSDHNKFAQPIDDLITELGTDGLKNEDPANAAIEIRRRIEDTEKRLGSAGLLEQSDMGRIYDQWLDMYSKMKADDPRRETMWDALMYMQKMRKYDEGYYAPLLGIDYVDHDGVILVHNRGTVAVLDVAKPLSGGEASTIIREARGS